MIRPSIDEMNADFELRLARLEESKLATDELIERVDRAAAITAAISADYRVAIVTVADSFMRAIVAVSETYNHILADGDEPQSVTK